MHVMYRTSKSRVARLANKGRPAAGIGPLRSAIKCTPYNWYNTIMLSCRGLHVYDGTIWNDYVRIVVRRSGRGRVPCGVSWTRHVQTVRGRCASSHVPGTTAARVMIDVAIRHRRVVRLLVAAAAFPDNVAHFVQ